MKIPALVALATATTLLGATPASAAEVKSYSYDARGRLVKVVRTGFPAGESTRNYNYDRADNRSRTLTHRSAG